MTRILGHITQYGFAFYLLDRMFWGSQLPNLEQSYEEALMQQRTEISSHSWKRPHPVKPQMIAALTVILVAVLWKI